MRSRWLHKTFGGSIKLLKESLEPGAKTPDYLWNGKAWELKSPQSTKNVDSIVRNALKQIRDNPGGIILNFSGIEVELDEVLDTAMKRINRSDIATADIMVVIDKELKRIMRYKKG